MFERILSLDFLYLRSAFSILVSSPLIINLLCTRMHLNAYRLLTIKYSVSSCICDLYILLRICSICSVIYTTRIYTLYFRMHLRNFISMSMTFIRSDFYFIFIRNILTFYDRRFHSPHEIVSWNNQLHELRSSR